MSIPLTIPLFFDIANPSWWAAYIKVPINTPALTFKLIISEYKKEISSYARFSESLFFIIKVVYDIDQIFFLIVTKIWPLIKIILLTEAVASNLIAVVVKGELRQYTNGSPLDGVFWTSTKRRAPVDFFNMWRLLTVYLLV